MQGLVNCVNVVDFRTRSEVDTPDIVLIPAARIEDRAGIAVNILLKFINVVNCNPAEAVLDRVKSKKLFQVKIQRLKRKDLLKK